MDENKERSTVIRDILIGSMSLLLLLVMILINTNNKIGLISKIKAVKDGGVFPKIIIIIIAIVFVLFIVSLLMSMVLRFIKVDNKLSSVTYSSLNVLNVFPIVFIFLLLLDTFFLSTAQVDGTSMNDTLYSGDVVLVSRLGLNKLEKGDIIIIDYKDGSEYTLLVKRLWAKEGDVITFKDVDGHAIFSLNGDETDTGPSRGRSYAFINEEYTLKEGEIFVIGDHFYNSLDSRVRGVLRTTGDDKNAEVCGKLIYSLKPFGKIKDPKYKLN